MAEARLGGAALVALTLLRFASSFGFFALATGTRRRTSPKPIRRLTGAANVSVDRPAVEAGLAVLEAGGDFADGRHRPRGAWLGADTFVVRPAGRGLSSGQGCRGGLARLAPPYSLKPSPAPGSGRVRPTG